MVNGERRWLRQEDPHFDEALQDKLACFALDVLKDEGYGTTSSGRFR